MEMTSTSFKARSGRIFRMLLVAQALLLFIVGPSLTVNAGNVLRDYKLSLSMNGVSIKSAIEEIKKQTDLSFVYNERDINGVGSVNLNFKNKSVEEILSHILKDTKLSYDIVEGVIVIKKAPERVSTEPQAKKRVIKGVVTDETKATLPGVAVKVKGTSIGIATDVDGKYELIVDENPNVVLEYSFVGMKTQEIKIGNQMAINVQLMSASTDLDEVIVVAYGTMKKEAFTGSAASVKGDDVIKAAASKTTPERALQGTVAGVRFNRGGGQPGGNADIQIRGIGSLNETTSPLYVIDGVPISTAMDMFNPDDIESMTVLKDAAATSLYGSRASNGVIMITTKKGKEGKTKFDITYERGWSYESRYEIKDRWMNSGDYATYALEALKNQQLDDWDALPWQTNYGANDQEMQDKARKIALEKLHSTIGLIHPDDPMDGTFDYKKADYEKYLTHPKSYDWYNALFRTGVENKVNLSARGGSKDLQYYASLGYVKQEGIANGSNFERYTGRVSVTNKVSKLFNFTLSETVGYSIWDSNTEGSYNSNPITGFRRINPTQPIYMADGEFNPTPGFSTNTPNYVQNFTETLYHSDDFSSISNLSLELNLTNWLHFRSVNGVDLNHGENKTTWTSKSTDGASTNGQVSKNADLRVNLVTSNTMNFDKTFDKHSLAALVGYEAKKYHKSTLYGEGQNFTSYKLMYLSNAAVPTGVGESVSDDRLISWISKVDYSYDNKYYLSGSYRRDGTSRLLKDNRWGNFWSVSGAWNMTKEDFMSNTSDWLDNLRLKLSYGTNGNQPGSYFNSLTLYSVDGKHNMNPASIIYSYGNPDLKWESSYTWNAGVDFSLWNGRLRGVIEYYNRHTVDLIDNIIVPRMASGFSSIIGNEGELRNTGVEISLDSRNIQTGDFTWTTNFNISYMKAMVEKLKDPKYDTDLVHLTKQGEDIHTFYLREWAGVNPTTGQASWYKNGKDKNGNVIDRSITYNTDEAERVITGKGYPDWFGGMTNKFTYKGFELSFLLTFTLGGQIFDREQSYGVPDGKFKSSNVRNDADDNYWKKPGDQAKDPIVIYNNPYNTNGNPSTRAVISSNHLRVKNITFGYSLPKQWLKPIGLSNVKIYANGNDVLTFFSNKYLNPEVGLSGLSYNSSWPALKSWRVGINIQF